MHKKGGAFLLVLALMFPFIAALGDDNSAYDATVKEKLDRAALIASVVGALGAGLVIWKGMKQKDRKPRIAVAWIALIAAVVLIGYSYYYFTLVGDETEGIVVCEAGQCFWASHIHSELYVEICGEEWDPGLEKGPLGETHTHKERNKLHFHERLPVDPVTKEVRDWDLLRLRTLFADIGVNFTAECIGEKCNGDLCGSTPGKVSMTVNGVPNTEYENYAWKEGEVIQIRFN